MSSNNQKLAKDLQAALKSFGYEVKLGHAYETLSKLAGHASYNVASAKNADLTEIIGQVVSLDVKSVDVSKRTLPRFEVKVKFGSASRSETEIKKYYIVNAENPAEARKIITQYLEVRNEEIKYEDADYPQTIALLQAESQSEFETENWQVAALPSSFPYVEEVYPIKPSKRERATLEKTLAEESDELAYSAKVAARISYPVQRLLRGKTVLDVSECPATNEGDYFVSEFRDNMDYWIGDPNLPGSKPVWSIGKNKKTGQIFASPTGRFYQNEDFDCLFLR